LFKETLVSAAGPPRNCSPDGPLTCRYIHGQVDREQLDGETVRSTRIGACWKC